MDNKGPRCEQPGRNADQTISPNRADYRHGDFVSYACTNPNHRLEGNEKRHCQISGLWSGAAPSCVSRTHSFPRTPMCPPMDGYHGSPPEYSMERNEMEKINESIFKKPCREGFLLKTMPEPDQLLKCNPPSDGHPEYYWGNGHNPPVCVEICNNNCCGPPPNLEDGNYSYLENDKVSYSCNEGSQLFNGSSKVTGNLLNVSCENGSWQFPSGHKCQNEISDSPNIDSHVPLDNHDASTAPTELQHTLLWYKEPAATIPTKYHVNMLSETNGTNFSNCFFLGMGVGSAIVILVVAIILIIIFWKKICQWMGRSGTPSGESA